MNFRKIVSHLAYSPTMIWQLAEYDKKNKQDSKNCKRIILLCLLNIVVIFTSFFTNTTADKINVVNHTSYHSSDLTYRINVVDLTSNKENPSFIPNNTVIKYTISATNNSGKTVSEENIVDLTDILEYADLDSNTTISDSKFHWNLVLEPNNSESITFMFKTHTDFSKKHVNNESHNCKLELQMGNTKDIRSLNCPLVKKFDVLTSQMQKTHQVHHVTKSIFILLVLISIVKLIHYLKINFISKEVRIIRHKINQGGF